MKLDEIKINELIDKATPKKVLKKDSTCGSIIKTEKYYPGLNMWLPDEEYRTSKIVIPVCPICGYEHLSPNKGQQNYCNICGQALDWSDYRK